MAHVINNMAAKWEEVSMRYPPGWVEWVGSAGVQIIGFLLPGMLFLIVDLLQPSVAWNGRIQHQSKQPSRRQIVSCLTLVLWNHVYLIGSHFLWMWVLGFRYCNFRMDPQIPSVREVVRHCLVGALIRDVLFYYVHRLMHTKPMYRLFHRVHHEFRAPIALAAVYSHTVDHAMQNSMPIFMAMWLQRAHFLTVLFFTAVALIDAAISHSGYNMWRIPSVEEHDIHHEKSNVNFGVLGIMDWLHGTHAKQMVK